MKKLGLALLGVMVAALVATSSAAAFTPTNPYYGKQWYLSQDRAFDAWFGGGTSEAIVDFAFLYEIPFGPFSPWFVYQGSGPSVTIERVNGEETDHGPGVVVPVPCLGNSARTRQWKTPVPVSFEKDVAGIRKSVKVRVVPSG